MLSWRVQCPTLQHPWRIYLLMAAEPPPHPIYWLRSCQCDTTVTTLHCIPCKKSSPSYQLRFLRFWSSGFFSHQGNRSGLHQWSTGNLPVFIPAWIRHIVWGNVLGLYTAFMYILYLEEISDRHEGTIMLVWQAVKVFPIICLQLHQNRLHKKALTRDRRKEQFPKNIYGI